MTTIGVGVIGCGDIARVRFFPSIAALPEIRLKGVYSRTASACEDIVAKYGGTLYRDLDAFLADPTIEAVIIATPHPSHADLTVRSLRAGKHVLTEKPIATGLVDARRIAEAAAQSGRIFMALPTDASPAIVEAKRLIESGAIGRVNSADAMLAHDGPSHARWFFDREQAGWGVAADLGIYLISQLTYLLGRVARVSGAVKTVFPERRAADGAPFTATVDDSVAAILAWPDDILATIRANWCSPGDRRDVICDTRIYGTEGLIFINLASETDPLIVYSPRRPIEGLSEISFNGLTNCYRPALPPGDPHQIVRFFADAIRTNDADGVCGQAAARQQHVIEIIAGLYESSACGRAIDLDRSIAGLVARPARFPDWPTGQIE